MAFEDCNLDIVGDFHDIILENIDSDWSGAFLDSQLCIPQDSIEELEWFPNDFISLNNAEEEWMPELNEWWMPKQQQNKDGEDDNNFKVKSQNKDDNENKDEADNELQNKDDDFKNKDDDLKKDDDDLKKDEANNDESQNKKDDDDEKKKDEANDESQNDDEKNDEESLQHGFIGKKNYQNPKCALTYLKKTRSKKTKSKKSNNYQKPKCAMTTWCVGTTWLRRRCSHCDTEETPLWRNGPLGPKTLCNACGVRFKSGRLVPEYRPASSPSFDNSKHSNYHRNILKMRRRSPH